MYISSYETCTLNKFSLNPQNQREALYLPNIRVIASEIFVQALSLDRDTDVESSTNLSDLKWIHFLRCMTETGKRVNDRPLEELNSRI